ncbi:MAG TPA: response regulator [Kofleriaceae bacterium]|nr:response regulator [Kofleriaceae bacterium]
MAKRILLVEDSPIIQAAAVHTLTEAGFRVTACSTFGELIAAGVDGHDLILMDVQMPELFGDDVAMVLRHERGVTIPIYLFSSLPPDDLAARANAAGVDGFISKDQGMDHMLERVRQILG